MRTPSTMDSPNTTRARVQPSVDAGKHSIDERFGVVLRGLREARGWSLSYVGEVCRTSGANVSKIERGGGKEYGLALLTRLAEAYGMKLYELFARLESIDVGANSADDGESTLIAAYRSMPDAQRETLISVATTLRPVD